MRNEGLSTSLDRYQVEVAGVPAPPSKATGTQRQSRPDADKSFFCFATTNDESPRLRITLTSTIRLERPLA